MDNSKICVINVSVGKWYPRGQDRLSKSLDNIGYKGKKLFWKNSYPHFCPSHQKIPYAFKPYAFREAQKRGFDMALWIDSAVYAIKPIDCYFQRMEQEGHVLMKNGWSNGEWCTDAALNTLGLTREEALKMPHLMACVMGLNFKTERSLKFLDEWFKLANDGITFPGPWTNKNGEASSDKRVLGHRHDQTAASTISYRLGMKWMSDAECGVFYYDGRPYDRLPEGVILLTRGM